MADQAGRAAAAASMAFCVSFALQRGTVSTTSPVAGLRISVVRPPSASIHSPFTQHFTVHLLYPLRNADCGMRNVDRRSSDQPAGRSKRPRCKAACEGPSEAYTGSAAASARARQRRRWAVFSGLLGRCDDHRFGLHIVVQRLDAVLLAETALLHAAEGQLVVDDLGRVDPGVAGLDPLRRPGGPGQVPRPDGRAEAEDGVVGARDALVQ